MALGGNITNEEMDKAQSDLHKAESLQETMKKVNAIIRSKKNVSERLVKEAGLSESSAYKIQQPDYAGRIGFATYQLTNNNASIKRLQERVKMLEKKVEGVKAAEQGSEEKYTFEGGLIEVNYPEDRVQILFPGGRTDKEMYKMLRSNGYVYSPSNRAFQRKLTPQAIRNAVHIMKATKIEGAEPEAVVEPEQLEQIEVLEPNTDQEFDEAIMSNIEPHDSWKGNLIKERDTYYQIRKQLQGSSPIEITNEAKRIFNEYSKKFSGELTDEFKTTEEIKEENATFQGIHHSYKNQYELNKAIEQLLTTKTENYTSDEKVWIRKYSGYGGLDKYGKTGKGGLFEYYTPKEVIERMWALAYKYGYNNGSVLEPSIATGEFLQYAPKDIRIVGYEINEFSAKICKILYPTVEVHLQPFEQTFIGKNNWTMKDNIGGLEKFDLVIGNPPYGDFSIVESRYMSGMGEKDHTRARNYVEYFIRRGLDLLKSGGLLIYIVGAQLKNGGNMFLDSGETPVKEYLASNCELMDAYRLPDSVFERTGVTSDIIVLKKN